ncbi:hypothetical protein [Alicyclobacillus fodiniaquatilis]|uniref:Fibronectin type-III domain-containing protein n=1 Tax=Alicyclobacillus fodiniaquatilis TaxID=1661150 RepID=A0ABW4JHD0_9BACL
MPVIAKPTYDNEIKAQPSGSTYPWAVSTGALDVNFGGTIGTDNAIQIIKDGYQFAWKPDTVEVMDTDGNLTAVSTVNANAEAQVWQNQLTYVGTTPLTSDEFVVQGNQLKHTVRMVAPPRLPDGYTATPQYLAIGGDIGTTTEDWSDIELWADGATHLSDFVTSDDLVFKKKSDGSEVYRIPHIVMTDAAGNETAGQYKMVFQSNNTVTLYMLVDWTTLQNAVYPVLIDPTVIVASGYTISANGGRQIVRLSNGWIVIATIDGMQSVLFYVSKDDGNTWSKLNGWSFPTTNVNNICIASTGTMVYAFVYRSDFNTAYVYWFDASTVTSGNYNEVQVFWGSSSSFTDGDGSIAIDGNGKVWVAVSQKDGNGVFQIMVNTVTNGASGTPTAITSAGGASTCPNIVIFPNNNVAVFSQYYVGTSGYTIMVNFWDGTSWSPSGEAFGYAVHQGSTTLYQYSPCGIVDGNGNLHCFWYGLNPINGTNYIAIWHSVSSNNGQTWSPIEYVGMYQSSGIFWYPSVGYDPNKNQIYVAFGYEFSQYGSLLFFAGNTGSWTAVDTNDSSLNYALNSGRLGIQVLWSQFNANSSDAIRYIYLYEDGQGNESLEYNSISLNGPPNAPILSTISNFDATTAQTLPWTFSDPNPGDTQSAFELQIVDVSSGSTVVDTGKVASTTSSYALAANTLTNGKQYQWRVCTWDEDGAQGPYSQYSTFTTAAAPNVSITSPTAGSTDAASSETVQWSYSDPGNNPQATYQVQLTDDSGTVLWDSGVVQSQSARALTIRYTLANNTSYHIHVTVTNNKGLSSQVADVAFSTSFTAPAQPTIKAESYQGYIAVIITNPAPTGKEPTVASNDIYRRKSGAASWTRIATGMPINSTYPDYAVASGQSYDYKVTATGNNGTTIDSESATASITLAGVWLHDPLDAEGTVHRFKLMEQGRTAQVSYTSTSMQFEGRTLPVMDVAGQETNQVVVTIDCLSAGGDLDVLRSLIASQNTLCYRDARGRKIYGLASSVPETETQWGTQVQLTVNAVDYEEAV